MYCADCDIDELAARIQAAVEEVDLTSGDPSLTTGDPLFETIRDTLLWSSEEEDRCDL